MIRRLFRWKKWYCLVVDSYYPHGKRTSRIFAWTYKLTPDQVVAWEKKLSTKHPIFMDATNIMIINIIPVSGQLKEETGD